MPFDLWIPPKPAIIRPAEPGLIRPKGLVQANFLPGWFPGAVMAAKPPPSIAFLGLTNGAAAAQNFTFNGVSIGAAGPTRRSIFVVHTNNGVAFRTISSFTVDGVSVLPAHITINTSGFVAGHLAIFSILKPTGTTANLQINTNGTNAQMTVHRFLALDETVATPNATMTDGTVTGNTVNSTINIPSNGWVMAAAGGSGLPSATGINWTGVTEVVDGVIGTTLVRSSSGIQNLLPLQAGRPVSAVVQTSTSGQQAGLIGISWG